MRGSDSAASSLYERESINSFDGVAILPPMSARFEDRNREDLERCAGARLTPHTTRADEG